MPPFLTATAVAFVAAAAWLVVLIGVSALFGLQLGARIAHRRRAGSLDPAGTGRARRKNLGMGYGRPGELPWIPPETHAWLEQRNTHALAYNLMSVLAAVVLSVGVLSVAGGDGLRGFGLAALAFLTALGLAHAAMTIAGARGKQAGIDRADREWREHHPTEDHEDPRG